MRKSKEEQIKIIGSVLGAQTWEKKELLTAEEEEILNEYMDSYTSYSDEEAVRHLVHLFNKSDEEINTVLLKIGDLEKANVTDEIKDTVEGLAELTDRKVNAPPLETNAGIPNKYIYDKTNQFDYMGICVNVAKKAIDKVYLPNHEGEPCITKKDLIQVAAMAILKVIDRHPDKKKEYKLLKTVANYAVREVLPQSFHGYSNDASTLRKTIAKELGEDPLTPKELEDLKLVRDAVTIRDIGFNDLPQEDCPGASVVSVSNEYSLGDTTPNVQYRGTTANIVPSLLQESDHKAFMIDFENEFESKVDKDTSDIARELMRGAKKTDLYNNLKVTRRKVDKAFKLLEEWLNERESR